MFHLQNSRQTRVSLTNVGATITSIQVYDKLHRIGEISLGFDEPAKYVSPEYLADYPYLGATIGRFGNRIAGGQFSLDGVTYNLETNNGPNHLHGGNHSFGTKAWDAEPFEQADRMGVKMRYKSPHLENGYPGNLEVEVVFTLTDENELVLDYFATTDRATVLNLTNHAYFNLKGDGSEVFDHQLVMYANRFTPKDETGIPTGQLVAVNDSPLDFTTPRKIGERIREFADGYDHNYVVNGIEGELRPAARVWEEETGRTLEFYTTEPGFQFYTGHYLSGQHGRNHIRFKQYSGFCLEAQHFPNSPNEPAFPSTVLRPGETYTQTTVYKFGLL